MTRTEFQLDGSGPLYRQIRRAIAEPILTGQLSPGTRLPSEHAFMEVFDTSRTTINRALQMLADEGLVSRHRRNGTFVAAQVTEHAVLELRDIADEIQSTGADYTYELLEREVANIDKSQSKEFGFRDGTSALYLKCRHLADGIPFVIEDRYISVGSVPDVSNEPFTDTPPSRWLLENVPWSRAEHSIHAVNATDEDATLLCIPISAACLQIERTTWLGERPVTHVLLTYPGNRHRLVGRFSPGQ